MSFLTPPPHLSMRAGCHIFRRQGAVFGRMPLCRQMRIGRGQIVFPGSNLPVGTDRAAAATDPGLHNGLPLMSFSTPPPDFASASVGNIIWRQITVFALIPLPEQILLPLSGAVII